MEKVATASAASKYAMKSLIDDLEKAQDILREARDQITQGFKELREDQESFSNENEVLDVNGS